MEKTKLYFSLLLACFSFVFGTDSTARSIELDYALAIPTPFIRDANHQHLLVYNTDGSVRGGAYSLYPYSQVYVVSLHTLQNSWFFEFFKKDFIFYGFKLPHEKIDGENLDYRWVDMVIVINRTIYPMGINEPFVRSVLNTLIGRELGLDDINSYAGVESIVPIPGNLSKYMFKSNWGSVKKGSKDLIFEISKKTSTITPGSSGALVFAKTTDVMGALSGPSYVYTDKIPIGILKCRDLKFPQRDGYDRYEMQSFDFIFDFDLWITELKSIPDVKYDPDCINVNGRGHGGT